PIRSPQIAPQLVLAIHGNVVGLHRGIRHRDDRRFTGPGIDPRERRAPRITHPKDIRILVGAHAARPLRPGKWSVEAQFVEAVIERAIFGLDAFHLGLDWRQFYFGYLTGLDIGPANRVHRHLRPPAVAIAIAGGPVGHAGAL